MVKANFEQKLEELIGREPYNDLQNHLKKSGIEEIEQLYRLEPQERIKLVMDYCSNTKKDFSRIYSAVEKAKEEIMKEYALRSAVSAILAREGPAAISNLNLYKVIRKRLEKNNK